MGICGDGGAGMSRWPPVTGHAHLSDAQVAAALAKLSAAYHQHVEWCDDLYATLACRLPPRRDDLDLRAHQRCGFGQWLRSDAAEPLRSREEFADVESEHETLHRAARKMLTASRGGGASPPTTSMPSGSC